MKRKYIFYIFFIVLIQNLQPCIELQSQLTLATQGNVDQSLLLQITHDQLIEFDAKYCRRYELLHEQVRLQAEVKKKLQTKGIDGSVQPLLSIIIPAYNRDRTIEEAVNSIYKQNLSFSFEVIIVDDASTDQTYEKVCALEKKYSNMHVYRNERNRRAPFTRNNAILRARGELIFNLDSDDVLSENSLEKLVELVLNNKLETAYFGDIHFFKNFNKFQLFMVRPQSCPITGFDIHQGIECDYIPMACTCKVFTRKSWERIGGYLDDYGHDSWSFSFMQLATGVKFYALPDTFYFHRLWTNQSNMFCTDQKHKRNDKSPLRVVRESPEVFTQETNDFLKKYNYPDGKFFPYIQKKRLHLRPGKALESLFEAYRYEENDCVGIACKAYEQAIQLGCDHKTTRLRFIKQLIVAHEYERALVEVKFLMGDR